MTSLNLKVENPGTRELRNFGLLSGSIVAVLFGLFLPWVFDYHWPVWPWILSGILGLWSLIHSDSLFIIYRVWLKFGHVAGWINTRIILGITFYLVFLPAGLIMRLVGKDPMMRKLDGNSESYRIHSDPIETNHIERPY